MDVCCLVVLFPWNFFSSSLTQRMEQGESGHTERNQRDWEHQETSPFPDRSGWLRPGTEVSHSTPNSDLESQTSGHPGLQRLILRTGDHYDGGATLCSAFHQCLTRLLEFGVFEMRMCLGSVSHEEGTWTLIFKTSCLLGSGWGMEVTGRAAVSFAVIQNPTFHRPFHRLGAFFMPHPSEVIPGPSGAGPAGARCTCVPVACQTEQSTSQRLPFDVSFPQCFAAHPPAPPLFP